MDFVGFFVIFFFILLLPLYEFDKFIHSDAGMFIAIFIGVLVAAFVVLIIVAWAKDKLEGKKKRR